MGSISNKIIALSLGAALSVGIAIGTIFLVMTLSISNDQIANLDTALRANFDRNARIEVEEAVSMLAADLVRELRYDKESYFWVDDSKGNKTEGTKRYGAKDAKGFEFIKAIIKTALEGGGYTDYWFPKAGSDVPLPKRGYSPYFQPTTGSSARLITSTTATRRSPDGVSPGRSSRR
jgi:methyl-accepting chemotaxis protein